MLRSKPSHRDSLSPLNDVENYIIRIQTGVFGADDVEIAFLMGTESDMCHTRLVYR